MCYANSNLRTPAGWRSVLSLRAVAPNMTDHSVRARPGWERVDTTYRYVADEGGVTVTVVEREDGYQVRASVDDDGSLVTHSEFLVSERESRDAAESDADSFVGALADELDSRPGTLTRAVEETAVAFEPQRSWLFG